ncbi:uncharacterized protein LOC124158480 [Ischnura elegans]|uniref:uncharacterized protein LOC124158480 n=1 Tax=Ischnura elegans TaxID=197161 RepID=UPI001ED88B31|nr:uncharacterized protein LOC124158480 [Ischnura elegans]XP_046389560.1 uncharacterized protein LOC124158480 [Ischnura elegans]
MQHPMRTKNFVLFLICIVLCSVFLFLFGNQRPSIQTIVTETHKQLNNLKNFKENLKDAEEKRLIADEKYLMLLGFTETPRLYPEDVLKNTTLPHIVTHVSEDQEKHGIGFARNVQHFLPNHSISIYNLGLGQYELEKLVKHCNSSRCSVINFDYSQFPSHVEDDRLQAYRPLLIQDALNRAGSVLFLDVSHRLFPGSYRALCAMVSKVTGKGSEKGPGILAHATRHPVSSLTHPKMFGYFHTEPAAYYFLPMIESSPLLLVNTHRVHSELMLPWVQCALTRDCLGPLGAQSAGCRFDKKPQYRYSGCHHYDGSALNVALGLMFQFEERRYVFLENEEPIVRKLTEDEIAAEAALLEEEEEGRGGPDDNATVSTPAVRHITP